MHLQDTMVHYFGIKLISFRFSVFFIILKSRRLKLCREYLFSNAVTIILLISDTQYYVPIKLCRMAENIHLFIIVRILTPENVILKQNLILDIIELDWEEIN